MNELIRRYKEKLLNYWQNLDKEKKIKLIVAIAFLIFSLVLFTVLATKTKYELTYIGVDEKTAGNIVTKLEEMGIPYQLSAGGSNISVPEAQSSRVKVLLAPEALGSGNIYSKFWENASFGMTNEQFELLERGAIAEELKALIKRLYGINDAFVMITLPKEKIFYTEDQQKATASVIVNIEPGVQLNPQQVNSIYNLVSGSVPNLPIENITLTNQYSEPLVYNGQSNGIGTSYNQQHQIQLDFQKEIKQEVERMLTRIMGPGKVIVTVIANMNFDQKRTVENIIEPVIDGKGIERSVETIQETFTGDGASQGGVTGTGSTQVPGYQAGSTDNGNYELIEKRVNLDVNEITKEVISSPYYLKDLSINVVVDMEDETEQSTKTKQAIRELLKPIVSAALTITPTDVEEKIAVVAYVFNRQDSLFDSNDSINPLLLYGAIGLSVLAIGGVGFSLVRRNGNKQVIAEEESNEEPPEFDFTPALTEEAALQQEIQKLSQQKPTEFVNLLRTWLSEE